MTTSTTPPSSTTPPHDRARRHDNPVRGPLNSLVLALLEGETHRLLGDVRERVFGALSGEVVDLGSGNGPTFKYLSRDVDVVHAIEPNPHFHTRLHDEAERRELEVVLHATGGEAMDLPDASVDAVMTSWVLCTVADPAAVLAEVRRILRPGGRLAFVEHVGASHGTAVRRVQELAHRPWKWFFEGCHTTRDTQSAILAAGFAQVDVEPVRMNTPIMPMRTQIAGTAWA